MCRQVVRAAGVRVGRPVLAATTSTPTRRSGTYWCMAARRTRARSAASRSRSASRTSTRGGSAAGTPPSGWCRAARTGTAASGRRPGWPARWEGMAWPSARAHSHILSALPTGQLPGRGRVRRVRVPGPPRRRLGNRAGKAGTTEHGGRGGWCPGNLACYSSSNIRPVQEPRGADEPLDLTPCQILDLEPGPDARCGTGCTGSPRDVIRPAAAEWDEREETPVADPRGGRQDRPVLAGLLRRAVARAHRPGHARSPSRSCSGATRASGCP